MNGRKRGRHRKWVYDLAIALCALVFVFCLVRLTQIFLSYRQGADSYGSVEKEAMNGSEGPIIAPLTNEAGEEEYFGPEPWEETPGEAQTEEGGAETQPQEGETQEKPKPLHYRFNGDTAALKAQNPDFIGWIYVPGTAVSYPMVQAADNDYYLRRTFERTDNDAGCIFLDAVIQEGLDARNPLIYGHNRRDGSMFATLKRYQKESFCRKYPYIYIFTTEGERVYEIFSVYVTLPGSDTYTYGFGSDAYFAEYAARMKSQSLYDTGVTVGPSDRILTLSTCTNRAADTRFVVQAKRIR